MSDLVERLRSTHGQLNDDDYWSALYAERKEAADEIERLRSEAAVLQSDNATLRNLHLTREAERAEHFKTMEAIGHDTEADLIEARKQLVKAKDALRQVRDAFWKLEAFQRHYHRDLTEGAFATMPIVQVIDAALTDD